MRKNITRQEAEKIKENLEEAISILERVTPKRGRPRQYASNAEKQAAYRERKKEGL